MRNLLVVLLFTSFSCTNTTQGEVETKSEIVKVETRSKSSSKKAKNIILMIGDGMGTSQIFAGLVKNGGHLNLENFKHSGFIKTHASDNFITDSGAGATAFATGKKTYNGAISVDDDGYELKTILEIAKENGLATGMVATSSITHATPACFAAHDESRNNYEAIARDIYRCGVDVFFGGGLQFFEPQGLVDSLLTAGYEIVKNMEELIVAANNKIAGLLALDYMPSMTEGRGDFLPMASKKAIEILGKSEKGFFLMIEGSQIDWGGHANDTEYIATEMVDFDNAIGEVLKYALLDTNTLIIVTADHETGGFAVSGGSYEEKEIEGSFTSGGHTAVMVPIFAYGSGAEMFTGIFDNTEVFDKMMEAFGFD
ncbi:MAG: alkaline phosphatase [Bacteroidetes bacterium]|nr:MAG: alkaline phosphatase [Bacteroidota bacterium]